MDGFRRLVAEIHRRSLWQVLGVYLAGSWLALQVVEQLAEAASLPEWVRPFALVLLVIGLPVVMATAFIQHGTDGGPDRGPARDPGSGRAAGALQPSTPVDTASGGSAAERLFTWKNAIAGGILAVAGWGIVATILLLTGGGPTAAGTASGTTTPGENRNVVAVLPFENLSADESNAFFADGVHEEILSTLSQIDAIRVISRTSVLRYAETELSLPEIGRELGAGAVLEGSVRRDDQRVRVAAQLIDVETDQHLWSQTFDGDLSDIFGIQTEIAQQITVALAAELTDEDETELAARPTENMAAYDAYLEGVSHRRRRLVREDAVASAQAFRRAVELDPNFAEGWAALARAEIWLEWNFGVPDAGPSAFAALERARALSPGTVPTFMAEGEVHYYGERDYESALRSFFAAERLAPNQAEVIESIGFIRRRQGRWDEALARWDQAMELDPYSDLAYTIGQSYARLRDFDRAERYLDLAVVAAPGLSAARELKFAVRLARRDTAGARRLLHESRDLVDDPEELRAWLALAGRDYESAVELAPPEYSSDILQPGLIAAALSSEATGRAVADSLRSAVERARDSLPYQAFTPMSAAGLARRDNTLLGLADALDGQFAAAREKVEGALGSFNLDTDAQVGYRTHFAAAVVETMAGTRGRAIEHLETLLANPTPISVGFLEVIPLFDSLRDEPEFQRLLEEYR